jgi:hypothetical protein
VSETFVAIGLAQKMRRNSLGGQNSEKLLRRSKNTSCLHSCCELRRPGTHSRCILQHKNGLLELFYYKKRMEEFTVAYVS